MDDDCKIRRVHFSHDHCCNECFLELHSDFQTSRIVSLRQSLMLLQTLPDSDHVCGCCQKTHGACRFCSLAHGFPMMRSSHIIQLEGLVDYMGVSKNRGTPKSSILIGFSIINHPFWDTPIFGNTHIVI